MRQDRFSMRSIILYLCGIIPVAWIALLIAPMLSGGLPEIVKNMGTAFNHICRSVV